MLFVLLHWFNVLRGRNLHMSPTDRPRPVMAQKMLQQSREAESALADALTFDGVDSYNRTPKGKGDHSDESETSSLCSERSHESYRKASDVSFQSESFPHHFTFSYETTVSI